ncbi:hypothetical protein K525DRAFT_218165 [Schizophyllum commune Loenen D]|nr:hypothetical protein K525DRAFT_218165 [Schizophyllum commune Loenen D]
MPSSQRPLRTLDDIIQEISLLGKADKGEPTEIKSNAEKQRRQRALIAALETLLAHHRPFAAFDQGPPRRHRYDEPFDPNTAPMVAARNGIRQYSWLRIRLNSLEHRVPSAVWTLLQAYEPVALDWVHLLHPRHKLVRHEEDNTDSLRLVEETLMLLDCLLLPSSKRRTALRDFALTTNLIPYTVDIWANLFRYVQDPPEKTVFRAAVVLQMATTAVWDAAHRVPPVIAEALVQSLRGHPRHLWHTLTAYWQQLTSEECADIKEWLISSAIGLILDVPEVRPTTCPREVIRYAVKSLDSYHTQKLWGAVTKVANLIYLLVSEPRDHRALEWAIRDDLFLAIRRLADDSEALLQTGVDEALAGLAERLYQGFNFWRVARAFHDKYSDYTLLNNSHALLKNIFIAYRERRQAMLDSERQWKEVKQHCSYGKCPLKSTSHESPPQLFTCVCHSVYYCSKDCQRKHWLMGHRDSCDWSVEGQTRYRDFHYIINICLFYAAVHWDAIFDEIHRIDPNREHHIDILVDLEAPEVRHRIELGSPLGEDTPPLDKAAPPEKAVHHVKRCGIIEARWVDGHEFVRRTLGTAINLNAWEDHYTISTNNSSPSLSSDSPSSLSRDCPSRSSDASSSQSNDSTPLPPGYTYSTMPLIPEPGAANIALAPLKLTAIKVRRVAQD